jgi:uncharacterized membrane protein
VSRKKSAVKAFTWRVIATTIGILIVWRITGVFSLDDFLKFGVADVILKLGAYYLHERIWDAVVPP